MKGVVIQLTIPKEQFEKITRLLKEYDYPNMQEFIREAIRQHVEDVSSTTEKWRRIHHNIKPQGGR